ncbi:MAG TPA: peptidase S41, partial [Ignavibacteria bacterium]|nr:peptidase S41 [Ignavibacteria bacterium]
GEFGEISPNGKFLAFTPRTRLFRTWKRYRGGMATDIWLYNFRNGTAKDITNSIANDELPMWFGNNIIYFLSDNGPHERFNIWAYSLKTKKMRQVTFFKNFDVHFPSIGPEDIVFENGGNLYLFSLKNEKYHKVNINVVTDEITLIPHTEKVSKYITGATISPEGNRVIFDARGDLFSVPAKHGVIVNLTKSPGVYERFPSWSPNGKYVAYWSDRTGEYQLTMKNIEKPDSEKSLTSFKTGFKYNLYWSPDGKKLAFIDKAMRIRIYDINKNKTILVDKGLWMYNGALENFSVSWSSDSRWIAYSRGLDNRHDAIFLYNFPENKRYQVTSGFYNSDDPVFGTSGKYLYFLTQQTFKPIYSSMQNTFIYTNATKIAAVSLRDNVPSILAPRNDEVKITKKEKKPEKTKGSKKEKTKKNEKKIEKLKIDINNFQERMVLLPIKAGRYGDLSAVKGKLIFHQYPNSGSGSNEKPVKYYDVKERKVKTIINNADFYQLTENGKKMLVGKSNNFAIINVEPKQKMSKLLPTNQLQMVIHPRAEWKQIFNDVWRFYRDYFYDPHMHGVNWNEMKNRYGKLLNYAITRWDVNYIIGQFIGELSSSHTYRFGGDLQRGKHENVGLLGVNWELSNDTYRIKKIIRAAKWDDNVRSPFDVPNIKVKAGDYILSVNGIKLDPAKDPYFAFQGLANKTVELTVNNKPSYKGAWKVIVKTLKSETRLRNLSWINKKREMVDKATDGKIGYIYVPNTGISGQDELVEQFLAQ